MNCRALAIKGDKCLHLDENDRYGGHISSYNLEHYLQYVDSKVNGASVKTDNMTNFKVLKPLNNGCFKNENDFKKMSRPCNIDLCPKVIFSKSLSVDMLIKSGTSHYLEFQNVPRNFFYSKNTFVQIPFSKSEIFTTSSLSLKEKKKRTYNPSPIRSIQSRRI